MEEEPRPKLCLYCGADNPEGRKNCYVCHNHIISEEEIAQSEDELFPVCHPSDPRLQLAFDEENGISYPDWRRLANLVYQTVPKENLWDTFYQLARQWLLQLKIDFGGSYRCYESENFLVLSAEGTARLER